MTAPSLAQRWRRTEPLRRRVALCAAIGSLGASALALLDATFARAGGAGSHGAIELWLADAGLTAPLGLCLGVVCGILSWLVHPHAEPTLAELLTRLRAAGAGRPADVAAFVPLAVLGALAWATVSGYLAQRLLALELGPRLCGLLVAIVSLLVGLFAAGLVLALTPTLRHVLARLRARMPAAVDPAVTLGVALVLCGALVAIGAITGTVSGEGGVLAVWGVLKRQELDLRAPGLLVALALAIWWLPALAAPALRPYQLLLVALVPLGLSLHSSSALAHDADLALLLERRAPLGRRALPALRRLGDRDGDGASRWFGGGDCDDRDPGIGPHADDVPDNGRDEDCSGSDLSLAAQPLPLPTAPPAAVRAPENGNVVLITVDTLRYDLGYMGYARPITPNIDALAQRSTVFERAYAMASYTGKAVGPMLIGKYASETHRNWGHFNKFGPEDTFVAERLQRAAIRTLAAHGHRYFGAFGGLERGFDALDLSAAPPEGVKWATDTTVTSDKLTDAAIRLLDQHGAGRFFLWVHYLDPHADYLHHEGIDFGNDARALYDGEVAFTDRHIGRLLDHLDEQPWAARTSIVLTSDHGEAFGEHGMWRHGFELWEPLVRVPLVVHVPASKPSRVKTARSQIDLVPTVLALLGVAQPPGPDAGGDDYVQGSSLLPDVFGEPPPARDILIDMPAGPYNEARRAYLHDDLKLVISRGAQKELFDLAADPDESKNVWPARRERIEAPYARFKTRLSEIEVKAP